MKNKELADTVNAIMGLSIALVKLTLHTWVVHKKFIPQDREIITKGLLVCDVCDQEIWKDKINVYVDVK